MIMEIKCKNKCGNFTEKGRSICYECMVCEIDREIDRGS